MAQGKLAPVRKGNKDEGLWLLSFADLSCILIAFFVLLLSYSKIDTDKMKQVEDSTKPKEKKQEQSKTPVESLEAVSKKLEDKVKELKLNDKMKVLYDADGVTLELTENLLFPTGSATAKSAFLDSLQPVLKLVGSTSERYHLTLEGHTDDRPIASGPFHSNWELSAARGISLLHILKARGIREERMSVHSYAHTKPKTPYATLRGLTLEKARATNRRVVIRIT